MRRSEETRMEGESGVEQGEEKRGREDRQEGGREEIKRGRIELITKIL